MSYGPLGRWPVIVWATGEQPVVVWDEGGSNEKTKEERGADLF